MITTRPTRSHPLGQITANGVQPLFVCCVGNVGSSKSPRALEHLLEQLRDTPSTWDFDNADSESVLDCTCTLAVRLRRCTMTDMPNRLFNGPDAVSLSSRRRHYCIKHIEGLRNDDTADVSAHDTTITAKLARLTCLRGTTPPQSPVQTSPRTFSRGVLAEHSRGETAAM
ncbi:hypothetical protein SVAN01_01622 [Stagonosporopsis vannaccii]|nr:hypothetical protein SVAN01_01622 [Stagonosporopsis vannaccii]